MTYARLLHVLGWGQYSAVICPLFQSNSFHIPCPATLVMYMIGKYIQVIFPEDTCKDRW